MVAKPGKPPTETNSYRPISLLPIMSTIFERLLLKEECIWDIGGKDRRKETTRKTKM
jgi:hypothetical protein